MTIGLLALLFILPFSARAITIQDVVSQKGIHAWLVQDDFVPLITVRFSFKGGRTQDPKGKEGLASLMAGLFDEGAGGLSSDVYQKKLDDNGAEMSFSPESDSIEGSMRMLSEKKDVAFDLLALAVAKPHFDQEPLERVRQQLVTSIKASERDPETIAFYKFKEVLYGDHPYARRPQGTEKSLMAITRNDLLDYHHKLFARSNLIVSVVGKITPQELSTFLDRVFGDLPEKADLVAIPDATVALGATTSVRYDLPQTSMMLVYPGVGRRDQNFFAASLVSQTLGGTSFLSRLFNEVREKRGLSYYINSSINTSAHSNVFVVTSATRAERAQETLQIIRDEISRMMKDGPTEKELAQAKAYEIGSYAVQHMDSSEAIAGALIQIQKDGFDRNYIDKRVDMINAVTLDQAKSVTKQLFTTAPAILLLGPTKI